MAIASNKRSTNRKQELRSLLQCSICLEPFDDPRTLSCFHSFCKKCLENVVKEKRHDDLNCPVCRAKFTLNEGGVAGMTKNYFICNMLEVMSVQDGKCIPCTHCQEPSVGRCVRCELFMCETCLQSHNGYVGFRDHVVFTVEELSKPENRSKIKNSSKCNQHPKKKLKYYCETCDELICRHCMEFDHDKQHKFAPLEQAAKSKREDLKTNRETLERTVNKRNKQHTFAPLEQVAKSKRERLKADCETLERTVDERNRETQALRECRQSLNSNFRKAHHNINERKDKLLAIVQEKLQTKTYSMIENIRRTFQRKLVLTNTRINEAEIFVNRVKVSSDMAHSLLQGANDEEIVRSYHSVQENVQKTREKRNVTLKDDVVMSWSPDEIDTMLLSEIEDIIKNEDRGVTKYNVKHEDNGEDEGMSKLVQSEAFNPRTGKWYSKDCLVFNPTTGKIENKGNAQRDDAVMIAMARMGFGPCGPEEMLSSPRP